MRWTQPNSVLTQVVAYATCPTEDGKLRELAEQTLNVHVRGGCVTVERLRDTHNQLIELLLHPFL